MMSRNINLKTISIICLMLFLSWGNFQISGLYFFVIFQVIFCFIAVFSSDKKIFLSKDDKIIWFLLFLSIITAVLTFFSSIPDSFKSYSLIMTVVLLPAYIAYVYLKHDFSINKNNFKLCIKWIKIGFLVQLIFIPIQLIFYNLDIDINNIIFNETLHLMENPSFYHNAYVLCPSGFTWHSAVLAPMLVLSFLMFSKNTWVKILVFFDACICGNTTALIGVLLTIVLLSLYQIRISSTNKSSNRVKIGIILVAASMAIIVCALNNNALTAVANKISYVWGRIFESNNDESSSVHISYYYLYPQVLSQNSILQNLFGTGYASSGYSISQINGQYGDLEHWVTETDFIDILISRGIIGFIAYYAFLIKIAIKGKKINYRYLIAMIVIILQGITYNVQFEYIFFIELIMYASICAGLNFFEDTEIIALKRNMHDIATIGGMSNEK